TTGRKKKRAVPEAMNVRMMRQVVCKRRSGSSRWAMVAASLRLVRPPRPITLQIPQHVGFLIEVAICGAEFVEGAGVGPLLEFHAINRQVGAGAMDAREAMDEHGEVRGIGHDAEKRLDAGIGRGGPAIGGPPALWGDANVLKVALPAKLFLAPIGFLARDGRIAQRDDRANPLVAHDALESRAAPLAQTTQ